MAVILFSTSVLNASSVSHPECLSGILPEFSCWSPSPLLQTHSSNCLSSCTSNGYLLLATIKSIFNPLAHFQALHVSILSIPQTRTLGSPLTPFSHPTFSPLANPTSFAFKISLSILCTATLTKHTLKSSRLFQLVQTTLLLFLYILVSNQQPRKCL